MSRRKEAVIPAELLDQLLAGTDAAAFSMPLARMGVRGLAPYQDCVLGWHHDPI
jgi:hypothetical protein